MKRSHAKDCPTENAGHCRIFGSSSTGCCGNWTKPPVTVRTGRSFPEKERCVAKWRASLRAVFVMSWMPHRRVIEADPPIGRGAFIMRSLVFPAIVREFSKIGLSVGEDPGHFVERPTVSVPNVTAKLYHLINDIASVSANKN